MISDFELVEEQAVTVSEVKKMLTGKKEKSVEEKAALSHAKSFSKLTPKQTGDMIKELKTLDMRKLKDEILYKIVDLMPEDIDDLKIILSMSKIAFKDEEINSIMDIVKKFV